MRLVQKLETCLIPQNLDSKVANTCTILLLTRTFHKNMIKRGVFKFATSILFKSSTDSVEVHKTHV